MLTIIITSIEIRLQFQNFQLLFQIQQLVDLLLKMKLINHTFL